MEFLLIILLLLFLLLWPVIKASFKVWRQVRQMNRTFQQAREAQYGGTRARSGQAGSDRQRRHRRRGKIFGPGDGEYVAFEEIIERRQSVQYVEVADAEPRITDATFEEIRL